MAIAAAYSQPTCHADSVTHAVVDEQDRNRQRVYANSHYEQTSTEQHKFGK